MYTFLQKVARKVSGYLNAIAGVPNYSRYLEELPSCQTPLSEKEFHQRANDNKYGNNNIRRCC